MQKADIKKHEDQLRKFTELLLEWNKTHNLVSRKTTQNINEHIEDSLLAAPLLRDNIMDLGSGGGFPGIPIAITNPQKKVYLVERRQTKAAFLLNTTNQLELDNTKVIHTDSRELKAHELGENLDIVARAFGSPKNTIKAIKSLLKTPGTRLKIMKTAPAPEPEEIPQNYEVEKIEEINLKGKDKGRILVTIRNKEP